LLRNQPTNQPTNPIQPNHADDEAPNPYCVVTVGKQSYKSKKKTKTFHPSWSNATFVLYVHIKLFQFSYSPFPVSLQPSSSPNGRCNHQFL
jgi:hypothetical protein